MSLARLAALLLAPMLVVLTVLAGSARADDLRPGYLELTQTSPSAWLPRNGCYPSMRTNV